MLALLAPVPKQHLSDAVDICGRNGNVAFGSGWPNEESSGAWAFEFFSQKLLAEEEGKLPVLIYVSHDLDDHGPLRAGFLGVYNGFLQALANGKHSLPAE